MIANKIVEATDRIDEFRARIVKGMSLIDLPLAIRISQQIKDHYYLVKALIHIAKQQAFEDRKETIIQCIEEAKSIRWSYAIQAPLRELSELLSSIQLRELFNHVLQKQSAFFKTEDNVTTIRCMISVMAALEPEWAISTALAFPKPKHIISSLSDIAVQLFPVSDTQAYNVIEMAVKRARTCDEFMRVARAVSNWDKTKGREIYKRALVVLEERPENSSSYCFLTMYKIFPDITYEYIHLILDDSVRARVLQRIGFIKKDKGIYAQGVDELMQLEKMLSINMLLDMSESFSFGEKFAVETARRFKKPEDRSKKIFELSRLVMKKNPQLAITLVKEGMEIVEKIDDLKNKIYCYRVFQGGV